MSSPPVLPPFSKPSIEQLSNRFTYHAPRGDQSRRYEAVRGVILHAAAALVALTPCTPEQARALNALDEAMFLANAAIARGECHLAAPSAGQDPDALFASINEKLTQIEEMVKPFVEVRNWLLGKMRGESEAKSSEGVNAVPWEFTRRSRVRVFPHVVELASGNWAGYAGRTLERAEAPGVWWVGLDTAREGMPPMAVPAPPQMFHECDLELLEGIELNEISSNDWLVATQTGRSSTGSAPILTRAATPEQLASPLRCDDPLCGKCHPAAAEAPPIDQIAPGCSPNVGADGTVYHAPAAADVGEIYRDLGTPNVGSGSIDSALAAPSAIPADGDAAPTTPPPPSADASA